MAAAKKKLIKKQDKACKKVKSKNQSIGIKRLALSNSKAVELDTFENIFSNLTTTLFKLDKTHTFFSNQLFDNNLALGLVFEIPSIADGLTATRLKNSKKKKTKSKTFSRRLSKRPRKKTFRAPTILFIVMELIKSGK